jgi:hypothetical protein
MENAMLNSTIESTLAKYLEFRIFELFKNQMIKTISPHCREGSKEDIYKHLFLCPSELSKKRNFQLHGVLSPFVCLWRTSALNWNTDNGLYGRSVLNRTFLYTDKDGKPRAEEGFQYDVTFDIELFSSSYYRTFRDRVNQDLLDMDRLRYFDIAVKELLTDCSKLTTRAEVLLTGIRPTDNVQDNQNNRSFDLNASYTVKITVPYCRNFDYINRIEIYLNENLIYEHSAEEVPEEPNP